MLCPMNAPFLHPVETPPATVPLTASAFRLLADHGAFDGVEGKLELVEGELTLAPVAGTQHQHVERRALRALFMQLIASGFADVLEVQSGGGFQVGEISLLGPDLMVVRKPEAPRAWVAEDVVVLIEVAFSSRATDLGKKAKLYAEAGIQDYWVLDVAAKALVVHRDPRGDRYGSVQTLEAPASVAALQEPALSVGVADLF